MAVGKLVLCFAVIFLLQQNVYGFNRNRIVNGSATPDGVFKFLPRLTMIAQGPALNNIENEICSSTIVSKRHILTAAHCVYMSLPYPEPPASKKGERIYRAPALLLHYHPKEKVVEVGGGFKIKKFHLDLHNYSLQTKYYVHPSYVNVQALIDDIAIIEFPEGTDLGITPITLASNYVEKDGDMAIAAGYGIYKWTSQLDEKGNPIPETPAVLQNVTVPVHTNCPPLPSEYLSTVLCTATHVRYADRGDSGGPLMVERNGKIYQVGVASMVATFNQTNNIRNFYTRVSLQCGWISKITKGLVNCEALPDESKPPPPPVDPFNPQPVKPNINTPTKVPLNETAAVTSLPVPSKPEALADNSSSAFTFNIFLFLFIGILCFA